ERHASAVARMARAAHQKPFELVNALVTAAGAVPAEAPDAGRAAFAAVLSAHGIPSSDLVAFDAARQYMRSEDAQAARAMPLVEALLALEFVDQFGDAVE